MQMYKGFNVITNKIPADERHGVPHHLLDFVDMKDQLIVNDWENAAISKVRMYIFTSESTFNKEAI